MKVLVADDDEITRCLVSGLVEDWGYTPLPAEDGSRAQEILASADAPEIAILDWMMPGMDGLDVCRTLRREPGAPYVYTVMLTARADRNHAIAALEAGADDYVAKPFDPTELKVRLGTGRRVMEMTHSLRLQGAHDSLTGVWNRGRIIELLHRELSHVDRAHGGLGVLMVDLDHFKSVNDTHGHLIGDAVVREVAHRMSAALRRYDVLGRYGGDEFLVLLRDADHGAALAVAERLREAVRGTPILTSAGEHEQTLSIGLCTVGGLEDVAAYEMILAADSALYAAKAKGRDRVEIELVGAPLLRGRPAFPQSAHRT